MAITARLGGPTSRVTLHQEDFGFGRVFFRAILELACKEVHIHRRFPPCQIAGFTCGFAGMCGLDDFGHNDLGDLGVFFKPFGQFFVHQVFDGRSNLGRNQLILRLGRKFRIRNLHRQHAGQALAGIIAGKADFFPFRDPAGLRIIVNCAGQGGAETGHVCTAIALRDVVGEWQNHLIVAVVPPHGDFDADVVTFTDHIDRFGQDRNFGPVDVFNEFFDAALIEQLSAQVFHWAFVFDDDARARI